MFEHKMRKFAAIVITALLLTSVFIMMPQGTLTAAASESIMEISIPVVDSLGPVTTATVILTEVHTGSNITAYFDSDSDTYVASGAPSGHYRIDIKASGYYSYKDPEGFPFDATANYTVNPEITLTKFGTFKYTANVTVEDGLGEELAGAKVMFYDPAKRQYVKSNTTDYLGNSKVSIFGSVSLHLVVSLKGYETYVEDVGIVAGDFARTITLDNSAVVSGYAYKASGGIAKNVVAYMYNTNDSIPWEKRILKSSGSFVRFDAYPGDWILVVDGPAVDPEIRWENITTRTPQSLNLLLDDQTESTEQVLIDMTDWNHLVITADAVWQADWAYPGLDNSDIGSLKAQIDIVLGNADGIVQGTEYSDFLDYLVTLHGPNYLTTDRLLTVNETQYVTDTVDSVILDDFSDTPVVSLGTVSYYSQVTYRSYAAIDVSSPIYEAYSVLPYDSAEMDRVFMINLMSNYELVDNDTLTSKIEVNGYYPTVTVDPLYSEIAGSESIKLVFEESEMPSAYAKIMAQSSVYQKLNNTTLLYYIVQAGTEITFQSFESRDPNHNPLTFNWDFGDGASNVTASTSIKHNYTSPNASLNVTMTVTDVSNMTNMTYFEVKVDGLAPAPVIEVITNQTGQVTIEQGDTLEFSPNGTVDSIAALADGLGMISTFEWIFGEEEPEYVSGDDEENRTVSHEFNTAGAITVVLNVTDVVGNYANTTVDIIVADRTSPSIKLGTLLNATGGTSLIERKPIFFNATETTDNVDEIANLTFMWDFGDDSEVIEGDGLNTSYVNHTYAGYGQYTLTLNVTDTENNTATLTRTINVGTGPRPRLVPTMITFEPAKFEEGKSGTITVNITNEGSATATNMEVKVWHYTLDTPKELIGTVTTFYDEAGQPITELAAGESAYCTLQWKPSSKGNYTLRAYTNCTDQTVEEWESEYVVVDEASWKAPLLYGGILGIFIVVPLLFFARRRIASGAGSIRRVKKEKEGKK